MRKTSFPEMKLLLRKVSFLKYRDLYPNFYKEESIMKEVRVRLLAIAPYILAFICGSTSFISVAFTVTGVTGTIAQFSRVAVMAAVVLGVAALSPIPLRWCKPYLTTIKKTGYLVHYTSPQAAVIIQQEAFIKPSGILSSYSNLFRRCSYLAHPLFKEATLKYNRMKGKVDSNSVVILVPYDEETFKNAKFRLVDLSIMIPGGVNL